jgi:hypothetical protein
MSRSLWRPAIAWAHDVVYIKEADMVAVMEMFVTSNDVNPPHLNARRACSVSGLPPIIRRKARVPDRRNRS